jgi:SAM-dependent methyltransferase
LEHLQGDRERASSFGADAEAYDAFRPGYPPALFDDLIDPDPRMAAMARRHGLDVEAGGFESWDAAGRQFDVIACGHAWHWVDALAGPSRAAALLRPGGRIVRFWNYHAVQPGLLERFERIYAELAPGLTVIGRDPSRDRDAPDPFTEDPAFLAARPRTYRWQRRLTSAQWVGLVGTFSDHRRLGPEALARLGAALDEAIRRHDGEVRVHGGTYVLTARRV